MSPAQRYRERHCTVGAFIHRDEHEKIQGIARRRGVSVSALAARLLRNEIERDEMQPVSTHNQSRG